MTVRVKKENGLSTGTHQVELTVIVRTAYIPVPLEGVKERTVEIAQEDYYSCQYFEHKENGKNKNCT